ncbi:Sel1 repeat protein [compost metagenome]
MVARDDGKAAKLYSQAAANGNVEAKIALAGFYENGRGVNKNPERAKRLMQEASEAPTASAAAAGR